jgi:hypothetical protein
VRTRRVRHRTGEPLHEALERVVTGAMHADDKLPPDTRRELAGPDREDLHDPARPKLALKCLSVALVLVDVNREDHYSSLLEFVRRGSVVSLRRAARIPPTTARSRVTPTAANQTTGSTSQLRGAEPAT